MMAWDRFDCTTYISFGYQLFRYSATLVSSKESTEHQGGAMLVKYVTHLFVSTAKMNVCISRFWMSSNKSVINCAILYFVSTLEN